MMRAEAFGPLEIPGHPKHAFGVTGQETAQRVSILQNPGVLRPAALAGIDDMEPWRSATRVNPPGNSHGSSADTANGRRSTWRAIDPFIVRVGQIESSTWAGSYTSLAPPSDEPGRDLAQLWSPSGPSQMPYPPDSSTALTTSSSRCRGVLARASGAGRYALDTGQYRLFGEIIADDLRNISIDRFIIGDAVSNGVGERYVPRAHGPHEFLDSNHACGRNISGSRNSSSRRR